MLDPEVCLPASSSTRNADTIGFETAKTCTLSINGSAGASTLMPSVFNSLNETSRVLSSIFSISIWAFFHEVWGQTSCR